MPKSHLLKRCPVYNSKVRPLLFINILRLISPSHEKDLEYANYILCTRVRPTHSKRRCPENDNKLHLQEQKIKSNIVKEKIFYYNY